MKLHILETCFEELTNVEVQKNAVGLGACPWQASPVRSQPYEIYESIDDRDVKTRDEKERLGEIT